jgi:aspartate/methionine/tyrosine aminotransferase
LVDETYRGMSFGPAPPLIAAMAQAGAERAVSVSSLSKSFGLPGVRLGWIVCRDRALMEALLATKEQIGICGSVVDEAIGRAALAGADAWLTATGARLREALASLRAWMAAEPLLEWVEPAGGCVAFPRIRAGAGVDIAAFYRSLEEDHGAFVGPGHWFEEDDRHFRIGYGWPTPEDLAGGLTAISTALRAAGGRG